jgi:ATP phosphoribosyltransferase
MLRVAFGKGRGASECVQLLDGAAPEDFREARLPCYRSDALGLEGLIVRGPDLPLYLGEGLADVALGSEIVFDEYAHDDARLVQAASLDVGICRLSLITKDPRPLARLERVAARYVRTARRLLEGMGLAPQILPLSGCVEVALHVGACDAIVDIVETGNTLRRMGFTEREVLRRVRHGIWIRRDAPGVLHRLRELAPALDYRAVEPS